MKPGDTASSTVDITNTGSLAGDFVLKTANPTGSTALLGQMQLTVARLRRVDGHRARLHDRHHERLQRHRQRPDQPSLGNYAGGIKHRYKFTATLPASTNDTFQGLTAGVDFAWSATQS